MSGRTLKLPLNIKHRYNVTKSVTQSLSGCLRLNTYEVSVSEDEMFAACMIEAVHPLDLPCLFPLPPKNSLNLRTMVHYELKLYQKVG